MRLPLADICTATTLECPGGNSRSKGMSPLGTSLLTTNSPCSTVLRLTRKAPSILWLATIRGSLALSLIHCKIPQPRWTTTAVVQQASRGGLLQTLPRRRPPCPPGTRPMTATSRGRQATPREARCQPLPNSYERSLDLPSASSAHSHFLTPLPPP